MKLKCKKCLLGIFMAVLVVVGMSACANMNDNTNKNNTNTNTNSNHSVNTTHNTNGNRSSTSSLESLDGLKDADETKETKMRIVTTIFPEYDWVREILGDRTSDTELIMLLDNGVDLHSYQPTIEDILNLSTCDVFVYVGGESSQWVEDALQEAINPDRTVICLLDVLGDSIKEEELVEGMQTETNLELELESESKIHETENASEHVEYDEHVWLSLKNANVFCEKIASVLEEKDPEHAEQYRLNAAAYMEKLSTLDKEYQDTVDGASKKTVLFGDRFPFRYLTDDYGLSYYAAFAGCSAETDASFETVLFLAQKTDELGLNSVLTVEKSNQKMAKTIVANTQKKDQKIASLDSMQSVNFNEISEDMTYLSVMERNLEVLKEALK